MKLYFDIGNTNIKLNFVKEQSLYVSYDSRKTYTVDSFWQFLPEDVKVANIENIMISSVVPEHTQIIEGVAKKYFKIIPQIIGPKLKTGLSLAIDDPKSLGSDLVALGVYANSIADNAIIVNLGTATTIIHIKNKKFLGAIIMVGIKTQLEAIVKKAAKISSINIAFQNLGVGKNTQESLSIGIVNSHVFSIQSHINKIDPDAKVVISGGNMSYVINHLDYHHIKEATIEGMKIIEEKNK